MRVTRVVTILMLVVGVAMIVQIWRTGRAARAGKSASAAVQATPGVLSAGQSYMLAISAEGDVYGWGNVVFDLDKIGRGSFPIPTQLSSGEKWGYVLAGTGATYAITTYGRLWRRPYFENRADLASLAQRRANAQSGSSEEDVPPIEFRPFLHRMRWRTVKQGLGATAGIDSTGNLWLWDERSLAFEDRRGRIFAEPKALAGIAPKRAWADVCLAPRVIYAVDEEGDLWKRSLANVRLEEMPDDSAGGGAGLEMTVAKAKGRFKRVACRENAPHLLALDLDNRLWGAGNNQFGELGTGEEFTRDLAIDESKMRPINDKSWADVAAGPSFTLGIAADGSLWAWGNNSDGQLGTGDTETHRMPALVDKTRSWVAVTAGHASGAALSGDGEIYTWGLNNGGVLGEGGVARVRNTPTRITGSVRWGAPAGM